VALMSARSFDPQRLDVDSQTWLIAASANAVAPGEMLGLELEGVAVALYNVEGVYYATNNVCTHAFAHLSEGYLDGPIIECPLHGGQFDVRTGSGQGAPITCDLQIFETRVVGDEVQVKLA
jgi:nitrite reductase/ring-hydroxylating ferredoxin subunit